MTEVRFRSRNGLGLQSFSKAAISALIAGALLFGTSACSGPQTKEVTPQACIDAIDRSTRIIELTTKAIDVNSEVNYRRMTNDAAAEAISELQPKVRAELNAWLAASEECRSKQH